ncbi:hypothetical protein GUB57_21715 [Escherichia coli]|uniref:Uncharacterized protein n=1 Tax=Escherichia coli TaxID=562 RepID=A0A6D0V2Y6_ECOLX|nr:hypothetical protein [Escherichia coli]MZW00543.1 hypothetical protein [Escherichia coli]NAG07276.1 hypothetical protein [Escherichia coli]NAG21794.1 hypothetical protein [Escherichia coli]NAG36674.1 hypothetical protein [Escherichia coli]
MRNYISLGKIDEEHFQLLISLTSITSEKLKTALKHYFVYGESQRSVCEQFRVNSSYFSLKVRLVQDVSRTVLYLYPYYADLYKNTCI